MRYDHLSEVLPRAGSPVASTDLPKAAAIKESDREACLIHDSADMPQLTAEQRRDVGPPSTPEELELNRLYAELADGFAVVSQVRNVDPGRMRHGQELERALCVYREANERLQAGARAVLIIAGAALTADNDQIEDGALAAAADERLPAARRVVIGNAARFIESLRQTQASAQEGHRKRKAARAAARQAQLLLSERRQEEVRQLAALATAPLPEPRA